MKKIPQQLDNELLNYIDGVFSLSEKDRIEKELSASPELQKRLEQLKDISAILSHSIVEQPSKNFTQRVMQHLDQYPVRSGLTPRNGILLLIGVLIAIGIGSFLLAAGIFDGTSTLDLNKLIIENQYIKEPLPSISFDGKLMMNIIIVLNIALGFLILDRVILKPWFDRRARIHF